MDIQQIQERNLADYLYSAMTSRTHSTSFKCLQKELAELAFSPAMKKQQQCQHCHHAAVEVMKSTPCQTQRDLATGVDQGTDTCCHVRATEDWAHQPSGHCCQGH